MAIRPSKIALYRYLRRDLAQCRGGIGLDAASNAMKNYSMFKTSVYFGLDIDKRALQRGLIRCPNAVGIVADLATVRLPANSVDVCVSTNTLEHLPPEDQPHALNTLVEAVKPSGCLLVSHRLDRMYTILMRRLRGAFSRVEVVYYRNRISRRYERTFEKRGFLGTHPIAGSPPFVFFAILLSGLEFLTWHTRELNGDAYIRCMGKRGDEGSGRAVLLEDAKMLGDNLYEL